MRCDVLENRLDELDEHNPNMKKLDVWHKSFLMSTPLKTSKFHRFLLIFSVLKTTILHMMSFPTFTIERCVPSVNYILLVILNTFQLLNFAIHFRNEGYYFLQR